jgi:hypothetical protein
MDYLYRVYHLESNKEFKIWFVFNFGGLYYRKMSIHQKINFKKESLFHHKETILYFLKSMNYKLSCLK